MDVDGILSVYDEWYADTYDDRFLTGHPWVRNLAEYGVEVIRALLPPGGRWLDVCCGTGWHLSQLPDVEREGLDLSPAMVARAREVNPGVTITEGSYLDPLPELKERFDLVTSLWLGYQFVDSLKDLELAVSNMASWVAPDGALFMHVADCEDVGRGTILPWEDPETPVFGDSLFITSITWTWRESNGRIQQDLVAPQLQRMVNIIARDFEEIEVRRWPAIGPDSGRPKGVIGRRKRSTPLTLEEVGTTYPYTLVYPPRDHPLEHDPHRPWDDDGASPEPPLAGPQAHEVLDRIGVLQAEVQQQAQELRRALDAQTNAVRGDVSALAEALLAARDQDEGRYDTVGVVHDQVWALRKDLADFYRAWEARPAPPPLDRVGTKALGRELARRLNPVSKQFWNRVRRRASRTKG